LLVVNIFFRDSIPLKIYASKSSLIDIHTALLYTYTRLPIYTISLVGICWYFIPVYPNLPQELGGAKPRQCIIEFKNDLFNGQTTNDFLEEKKGRIASGKEVKEGNVIRSKKVMVYYYNQDKLILKVPVSSEKYRVVELNRQDISLIEWL
jgi:hypothetical protein